MAESDSDVFEECKYRDVCEHLCERFRVASTDEIYWMDKMAAWLEGAECAYGTEEEE